LVPHPYYVLNVEVSATDGIETIVHGFSIKIIPNPSPASRLMKPDDLGKVTSEGIILEWEFDDDGYGPVVFDVYLGTSHTAVSMFQSETLFGKDLKTASVETGELEQGTTYYWTVVPKDIFSTGYCKNDVYSFRVNTPPEFSSIADRTITPGKELTLTFECSDLDSDSLEFTFLESPEGMELYSNMMTVYWSPTINQVGEHIMVIDAFDGLEHANISFTVTVEELTVEPEDEDGGSNVAFIVMIIVIMILLLIGAGIGALLFFKSRGKDTSEEDDKGPPDKDNDISPPSSTSPIGPPPN
jgi:hypothetical protein